MKKRSIAMVMALVLLLVCATAGTLAWLTAKSETVTNMFTVSGITVDLKETTGDEYQMIPGYTIGKDPIATVKANSEACYLFVKVIESDNFDDYMTYDMADGWTALDGVDGVYYREVAAGTADQNFTVLKDDQVSVRGTVDEADMTAAETDKPTLTFNVYASQLMKDNTNKFTAAEAWDNLGL